MQYCKILCELLVFEVFVVLTHKILMQQQYNWLHYSHFFWGGLFMVVPKTPKMYALLMKFFANRSTGFTLTVNANVLIRNLALFIVGLTLSCYHPKFWLNVCKTDLGIDIFVCCGIHLKLRWLQKVICCRCTVIIYIRDYYLFITGTYFRVSLKSFQWFRWYCVNRIFFFFYKIFM